MCDPTLILLDYEINGKAANNGKEKKLWTFDANTLPAQVFRAWTETTKVHEGERAAKRYAHLLITVLVHTSTEIKIC